MSALNIGDRVSIKRGGRIRKEAEVIGVSGDAVEFQVDGEEGTIFMELVPNGKGGFTMKHGSRSVECKQIY